MNSAMTRRATSVSMASSTGSSKGAPGGRLRHGHAAAVQRGRGARSPPWTPNPIGSDGALGGMQVEAGLGAAFGGRVVGQTGPFGDDPAQLANLQLESLVAEQRQRDPLAPDVGQRDLDRVQPLVVERRAEDGPTARRDDLGAAPERDRLVDPDPVAEDDERCRQLGVRPHQGPPRGRRPEPDLVRGGQVAPGRRRDVDQDLGAVEGQELGHRQMPEVLADGDPDPDPESRRHGAQQVAGGEEAPLVEQPVGRQEQLAVDVAELAVLEQGRRDEQPVICRFLDERYDRRQAARRRRQAAPGAGRRGASRPRTRGPAADSRSARARGRRPDRRPWREPPRGGRDGVARLTSSDPSRGAIWASAMVSVCTLRSIREGPPPERRIRRPDLRPSDRSERPMLVFPTPTPATRGQSRIRSSWEPCLHTLAGARDPPRSLSCWPSFSPPVARRSRHSRPRHRRRPLLPRPRPRARAPSSRAPIPPRTTPRVARRRRRIRPTARIAAASSGSWPRTPRPSSSSSAGRSRVPGQDRGARLRDQRHGLAAIPHRDDRHRRAGDRHRGERHGPVPARGLDPWLGDQPGAERRLLGDQRPRTSGSSCAGAPTRRRGSTELQNGTVDGIDGIDASGVATVSDDVSLKVEPRPGRMSSTSVSTRPTSRSTTRASAGRSRPASTGRRSSRTTFRRAPRSPRSTRRAPSRTAAPVARGTTTTRPWPRRCSPRPAFRTASRRRSATARPRPRRCPTPARSAAEIQSELLTNLGIQATLEVVPDDAYRASVDDGTLDGLHLFDRGATYPDAVGLPRPALRGGRIARIRAAVRRHRQGPGGGPAPRRSGPSATRPMPRSTT